MLTRRQMLTQKEVRILDHLQRPQPIDKHLFQVIARQLNLSVEDVWQAIEYFKKAGIVRKFSAIFDTTAMGFSSSLLAMKVKPGQEEEMSHIINRCPGVSHNYQRDVPYQLWFTLAVPPGLSFEAVTEYFRAQPLCQDLLLFKTIKRFKIGVVLDLKNREKGEKDQDLEINQDQGGVRDDAIKRSYDQLDRQIICQVQKEIQLVRYPFKEAATTLGISQDELVKRLQVMQEKGILRRISAILDHRKSGFLFNGMVTWQVDDKDLDNLGRKFSSYKPVSHCYIRNSFPQWPYQLYTMIHARSREDLEAIVEHMTAASGQTNYRICLSTREFKKQRVIYFNPEFEKWFIENIKGVAHDNTNN